MKTLLRGIVTIPKILSLSKHETKRRHLVVYELASGLVSVWAGAAEVSGSFAGSWAAAVSVCPVSASEEVQRVYFLLALITSSARIPHTKLSLSNCIMRVESL